LNNPFKNFDFSTIKNKKSLKENQYHHPSLSIVKEKDKKSKKNFSKK
jgi:hypothetical protein